jgi:signal transduction histidine kinase
MKAGHAPRHGKGTLVAYVSVGLALGAAYAFANTAFDALAREGPLVTALQAMHAFVDRVIPVIAGGLLGVAVHYGQRRLELARAEARRADEVTTRLLKVERDQAVWVVVASTLHEVKNPLHSLGLLLDDLGATVPPGDATADILARAGAQMERIKESLAQLRALAEGARPAIGAVALDQIVGDLLRDVSPIAQRDGIVLEIESAPRVRASGDPNFVRIILENLVGNSLDVLRARGGAGRVGISVSQGDGEALVRIHDDGPGIDVAVGESLFEPLATTNARGLGLGLSIARALARAMRGEVIHEKTGAGAWSTTFLLRLPEEAAS